MSVWLLQETVFILCLTKVGQLFDEGQTAVRRRSDNCLTLVGHKYAFMMGKFFSPIIQKWVAVCRYAVLHSSNIIEKIDFFFLG
jgi:hypothetical protein